MSAPPVGTSTSIGPSTSSSQGIADHVAGTPINQALGLREFHPFSASGEHFLYMVPSAGVFHIDGPSYEVLKVLNGVGLAPDEITAALSDRYRADEVAQAITELITIQAIGSVAAAVEPVLPQLPPKDFPLQTMVLNVTNKCNLACTY